MKKKEKKAPDKAFNWGFNKKTPILVKSEKHEKTHIKLENRKKTSPLKSKKARNLTPTLQ